MSPSQPWDPSGRYSPWATTEHLIDGWPWGWGAVSAIGSPRWPSKRWMCCGRKFRKGEGGLLFANGAILCAECARAKCQTEYTSCDLIETELTRELR